ncbi:MAG: restriction endonuclease [Candidatus Stahlbacteria bacterium]|nr:restriction endonuclease [Candidatus Stahlbacteria bacterium]
MINNVLYCGDNLEVLEKLEKESIDLIYIDPPFFSNKQYEVVWGDEAEKRSFEDRWEGGTEHYIGWMKPRVQLMYEVLKPTGSFYLHCDWHANAHLRIMLDDIFGRNNFRNEIIWSYETGGIPQKDFSRKHDSIFRYSKSDRYIFNSKEIEEKRSDEVLRRIASGIPGAARSKGEYRHPSDVWRIPSINAMAKERQGYPTQKPEELLERIIKVSSIKGDIVLDAFCGCGTTMAVAHRLKRKWIGIDISPIAIKLVEKRLKKIGTIKSKHYETIGLPITEKDLKKLKPFEFQNWVINAMEAKHSKKKSGDLGLDGYLLYGELFKKGSAGIQVKQSEGIGRNVIDNFKSALERANYKIGYLIAFSFGKGAYEEVARLKNKGETDIELVKVEDLINKKWKAKNE